MLLSYTLHGLPLAHFESEVKERGKGGSEGASSVCRVCSAVLSISVRGQPPSFYLIQPQCVYVWKYLVLSIITYI